MLRVLKRKSDIDAARDELRKRGLDTSTGIKRRLFQLRYLLRFRKLAPPVSFNKSWDVLNILNEVEMNFSDRDISIFEMGSYNSEIPLVLWDAGYTNIRASDLNPLGRCINWYGNKINFQKEDYYHPNVPEESFDVMTSLSVIEHGYNQKRFLELCQKYLKKNGRVYFTTDYHKEKITIDPNYRLFNLPYMIFSQDEIQSLIEDAKNYGLEPIAEVKWEDSEYPIEFLGHNMTFIFLGLRRIS